MVDLRFPVWLKKKLPGGKEFNETYNILKQSGLPTVCENARCPNIGECFSRKTATFLILGNICTRGCLFCDIKTGKPDLTDLDEPEKILAAVRRLGLKYVVITSVTRDDLSDGGAGHFRAVIEALKTEKGLKVEVLIPDFNGNTESLKIIVQAAPEVIGHNIEMVKELYKSLRPSTANYKKSLDVLKELKRISPLCITKSGFMLGLGETEEQILELIEDIYSTGCDILTIGQYLRPSIGRAEVKEFISPQRFETIKQEALAKGFKTVYSGPFIRSSYKALDLYRKTKHD
ncbi:MAG: lipoyl synthase [Candidatus Firestonebacteria bacterium RIFOXYA2_FULL_40_8]|nr:MAG: lipoyl synthase [Candidatus Firestonebacteria bacterium RIFOXYA2_FULL_40_8]